MADTTARAAGRSQEDSYAADMPGQKAADTMAEVARRAMDQGEEAVRLTLQAIAAAQAPVAERSLADYVRVSDSAAEIAKIYLQSTDRTTADLESFLRSYGQIGQAMQDWQKTAIDLTQRFMTRFGNAPQSLSRCTSLAEVAQWQRDIYSDVLNEAVAANHAILQTLSKVAENAMRALEPHPTRRQL